MPSDDAVMLSMHVLIHMPRLNKVAASPQAYLTRRLATLIRPPASYLAQGSFGATSGFAQRPLAMSYLSFTCEIQLSFCAGNLKSGLAEIHTEEFQCILPFSIQGQLPCREIRSTNPSRAAGRRSGEAHACWQQ